MGNTLVIIIIAAYVIQMAVLGMQVKVKMYNPNSMKNKCAA